MSLEEYKKKLAKLIEQVDKEYNFLYENGDRVAGYGEAVKWFDENQSRPDVKLWVDAYVRENKDFISSDREAGAFAFACEVLDIG
jgi:hypothetical protein